MPPFHRRLFLAVCLAVALGVGPGAGTARPQDTEAERLIARLRSPSFQEREAADRALRALGKAAVPALRKAARTTSDAEVRRRVEALLEVLDRERRTQERIAAVRQSPLPPREKGARLRGLLPTGMPRRQVHRLLGRPSAVLFFDAFTEEAYAAYQLSIRYDRDGAVLIATQQGW